jgi:hypothetical protein
MPVSGSDEQEHHYRDDCLASYSEVVVWRRRFYLALAAAVCPAGVDVALRQQGMKQAT